MSTVPPPLPDLPPPPPPPAYGARPARSTFVTGLAWLLIVGSALVSPMAAVFALLGLSGGKAGLYDVLWVTAACLVFPSLLVASIGLLKRKAWARLVVVSFLGLVALGELAGLVSMAAFTSKYLGSDVPGAGSMLVGYGASVLVLVALTGWIIWRLVTEPVRSEFG